MREPQLGQLHCACDFPRPLQGSEEWEGALVLQSHQGQKGASLRLLDTPPWTHSLL